MKYSSIVLIGGCILCVVFLAMTYEPPPEPPYNVVTTEGRVQPEPYYAEKQAELAWLMANLYSDEVEVLRAKLEIAQVYKTHPMKITAYSLTHEQCGADLANNALMKTPKVGDVAVSRDMEWMLGSKIKISGVGIYTVNDLLASTLKDGTPITKQIDIFMGQGSAALTKARKWGVKHKNVVVITK